MKLTVGVDDDGATITATAHGYHGVPGPDQLGQLLAELVVTALTGPHSPDTSPAQPRPVVNSVGRAGCRWGSSAGDPVAPQLSAVPARAAGAVDPMIAEAVVAADALADAGRDELRRAAYAMFDAGRTVAQVAVSLHLDRDTVRDWKRGARQP
jgi:hypothetical protein